MVPAIAFLGPPKGRHLRVPYRRRDVHLVRSDFDDPPTLASQGEGFAHPALPDEFLVQIPDARPGLRVTQGVIAAVG